MQNLCKCFFLIIVKHDLEESVEVFKGRNLDPLPRLPPLTVIDKRSKVKGHSVRHRRDRHHRNSSLTVTDRVGTHYLP